MNSPYFSNYVASTWQLGAFTQMPIEFIASFIFLCALLHTFSVSYFNKWAHRYPEGSVFENLFHLLGEVEVVFGLWAGLFFLIFSLLYSYPQALHFFEQLQFTEPAFVFVILVVSATAPVMKLAGDVLNFLALKIKFLPLSVSRYFVLMFIGPIIGSFITEPAAIAVVALLLKEYYLVHSTSQKFLYTSLGLLFVNISIGGCFTNFAAPPVLMVAAKWQITNAFMWEHISWRVLFAMFSNTLLVTWLLSDELLRLPQSSHKKHKETHIPFWISFVHLLFLAFIVLNNHHMVLFIPLFLFFLGVTEITKEYQSPLKLREGLLVAFFLSGLIVLGDFQSWWLKPLLAQLSESVLYFGATALTAITDNAALTYLGSQVEGLSLSMKIALLSGAVTGGGLTIIANAPNPAGFAILKDNFTNGELKPGALFFAALGPTVITIIWFLI